MTHSQYLDSLRRLDKLDEDLGTAGNALELIAEEYGENSAAYRDQARFVAALRVAYNAARAHHRKLAPFGD